MDKDEFEAHVVQLLEYRNCKNRSALDRLKHHQRLARLANQIYSTIENDTMDFKLKLMSNILAFLEKEDLS